MCFWFAINKEASKKLLKASQAGYKGSIPFARSILKEKEGVSWYYHYKLRHEI